MKTINNNVQFLLLLLFTSLLPFTQAIAQNNDKEKAEIHTQKINSDYRVSTTNPHVVLDGIEIDLRKTKKADFNREEIQDVLVVNTRTELGCNFCNLLKKYNKLNGVIYPCHVNVTEKILNGGLSSEIRIFVEENLIYKFRALAKKEYLLAAAQESNKRLKKYFDKERLYAGE